MTGVPFDPPWDSRTYVRLGSNGNNAAGRLTNADHPSISIAIIVIVLIFYNNINIKLSFTSSSAMAFAVRSEVQAVGTRTDIASVTSSPFRGRRQNTHKRYNSTTAVAGRHCGGCCSFTQDTEYQISMSSVGRRLASGGWRAVVRAREYRTAE